MLKVSKTALPDGYYWVYVWSDDKKIGRYKIKTDNSLSIFKVEEYAIGLFKKEIYTNT